MQNSELCNRYPYGSFLLERTTSNILLETKTTREWARRFFFVRVRTINKDRGLSVQVALDFEEVVYNSLRSC